MAKKIGTVLLMLIVSLILVSEALAQSRQEFSKEVLESEKSINEFLENNKIGAKKLSKFLTSYLIELDFSDYAEIDFIKNKDEAMTMAPVLGMMVFYDSSVSLLGKFEEIIKGLPQEDRLSNDAREITQGHFSELREMSKALIRTKGLVYFSMVLTKRLNEKIRREMVKTLDSAKRTLSKEDFNLLINGLPSSKEEKLDQSWAKGLEE